MKTQTETVNLKPTRQLTCCVCGAPTTGRQWWNRDTGYGICTPCVERESKTNGPETIKSYYGIAGIHHSVSAAPRRVWFSKGGK